MNPLLPLARALRRQGHEPVFATSASYCDRLERAGFTAVPAGVDWLEAEAHRTFPDLIDGGPTEWSATTRFAPVFTAASLAMLPDLSRLITEIGAAAVVHDSTEIGGRVAAEVAGVPPVSVSVGYQMMIAEQSAGTLSWWREGRAAFGLPADGRWSRVHPFLCLDSFPDTFQPQPPNELVDVRMRVRPEPPDESPPPRWLSELPERTTVYVSFGTVFNRSGRAFEIALGALAGLDLNVIAAIGSQDPAALPHADNIRFERHVPQHAVIAAADFIVTHAGYNTVVEALSHGIPMLAMPLGADQPYNAFRVAGAGAGIALSPGTVTETDVGDAVEALLNNDLYRANAQRLQRELCAMPTSDDAACAIIELAHDARSESFASTASA